MFLLSCFQSWNKNEQVIIRRVISCHVGPMYIETPNIFIYLIIHLDLKEKFIVWFFSAFFF